MFKNLKYHTLSHKTDSECSDMAYDGRKIYISTCNKQIVVFDERFTFVREIPASYSYRTLCYDNSNKCFWAISTEMPDILFQLSDELEIKEKFELSLNGVSPGAIDCLFYDESSGHMLASIGGHICIISPNGELRSFMKIEKLTETPLKTCVRPEYFLCMSLVEQEIHLKQYSYTTGEILGDEVVLGMSGAKSMITAKNNVQNSDFTLLILKENEDSTLSLAELQQEKTDVSMQQLCGNRVRCPYCMGASGCSHPGRPQPCGIYGGKPNQNGCMPPFPPGFTLPNLQEDCSKDCCDSNCDSPSRRYQACTQVIESIALTETSIAHILNAEGEKLQKAIACCRNVNELLKINESVMRTIIHSTQLEQMLFYKLDSALRGDICECQTGEKICCAQSADIKSDTEESSF